MPSRRRPTPLQFQGGWAPSLGPQSDAITHLVRAENIYYELDGGFRKIPGATQLNSSQITESGSAVTFHRLFDAWNSGTAGSFTQKRMAYVGTRIMKEDLDGTWDSLKTGLEDDKKGWFTSMNDLVVWASDSNTDVPQSWDFAAGSTSNLAGSPPNFAFCVPHRGRMWAAGVASTPSRLYYTVLDSVEDWTGSGSGSIDIDINDGDNILGLASHKQRLWVFKGPNLGSIHYITGSAPTGTDAFARVPFVRAVPISCQQSLVAYLNDLAWISQRGIHSLTATEQFGDMREGFLSFPIQHLWQMEGDIQLDLSTLDFSQGVNHTRRGVLLWTVRQSGQAENNLVLAYDYRFQPGQFSLINAYDAASLAIMVHQSESRLFSGGYDGYTLRHDEADRSIVSTGYTARVTTPFIHHGVPELMKQTAWLRLGIVPKGDSNITVSWQNDDNAQESTTVSQSSGAALDSFVLDTDTLGGSAFVQRFVDIPGSYRVQQLEFSQGGINEDVEVHELAVQLEGSGLAED